MSRPKVGFFMLCHPCEEGREDKLNKSAFSFKEVDRRGGSFRLGRGVLS